MARTPRTSTAGRPASIKRRDGDVDKDAGTVWYADHAHNYLNGRLTVGSAFPRFLALLGTELDCRSHEADARRELGVSATSLSQYQSANASQGMARSSLQVVCLKAKMWAKDLEFPDVAWAEEVDKSLREIGFKPSGRGSLQARVGKERWADLRREAERQGPPDEDSAVMASVRRMIITQQLPRDRSFDKLTVAGLIDEKPSKVLTALDKLVNEGTLRISDSELGHYYVTTLSQEAVDELLRVRLLVETMLIEELADNPARRKEIVATMQARLRGLGAAMRQDDVHRFVEHDIGFHSALATSRMCIEAILKQTLAVVTTAIPTPDKRPETYERIYREHSQILQLIRKGTQEALQEAVTCNQDHVTYAFRHVSPSGKRGEHDSPPATKTTQRSRRSVD